MTSPALEPADVRTTIAVLDDGTPYELFEVVSLEANVACVRTPFLFEIGEELSVRILRDGQVSEARARIRAHLAGPTPDAPRITELVLSEQTPPRRIVSG